MAATKASTRAHKEADLAKKAGDEVDAQLARYQSMRDFEVTAEPSGGSAKKSAARKTAPKNTAPNTGLSALPFVIQKHAATRLHYDFRLGWHGVLKSWAVAKGPSYDVHDRRLAVQVEDHPMEYGGFEGIIPRGQYGGGTVMVWDQGTWEPHVDVDEGLRKGSLKFALNGTKMHGNWTLVRMGGHAAQEGKPNWLLIKEHDEFERAPGQPCITEELPNSAVTGRSLEQIAEAETHVWNSKETAGEGQAWYRQRARAADQASSAHAAPSESPGLNQGPGTARTTPVVSFRPERPQLHRGRAVEKPASGVAAKSTAAYRDTSAPPSPQAKVGSTNTESAALVKLPKESLPEFLKPQLAAEVEEPPTGEDWLHELKLDGYRMQARKQGKTVQMLTRTGLDWTHRVKPIAVAIGRIAAQNAILDGEVVVLDAEGLSSFARLQASFEKGESHPLTYFAFDLLHLNGHNTRDLPLIDRKDLLRQVLGEDAEDLRLSEHITGDGAAVFHKACELHAEGTISKRATGKYAPGRGHAWVKSKCLHEQEFVIGGWKDLSNGTRGIGSLLLGYYDDQGKLIYAGKTGTGYTQKTHKLLRDLLDPLEQKSSPFAAIPSEARRNAHFVQPEHVAQVRFATWTGENQLRQAAYLGLREDKPARDVRKEEAAPTPKRDKHADSSPVPDISTAEPDRHTAEPHRLAAEPDLSTKLSFRPERPQLHRGRGAEKPASGSSTSAKPETSATLQPSAAASRKGGVSATTKTGGSQASPKPLPIPNIRLTHPKKIVDPETEITKEQFAQYLFAVADRMLPHIADRPLSLVRCPEGSSNQCFYQKHVNHMLPPGIGSVMVADKKGGPPEPYITLNTVEALTGLAQMTVLEIHPWGSTNQHLERPDRIVIDLDPDESLPWSQVTESANEVRTRLKKLGLKSFVKTTGGKGLHIVFPVVPKYDFRIMKAWAHGFVMQMERENPRLYLTKMTKAARTGKIYLDYLRNERGATAVAPYSMRSRPGLPVSVPLDWKELGDSQRPRFTIASFASEWRGRLKRDPWKNIAGLQQTLSREIVERFAGKL
ncbi:non-homologous end-joining DNA ligase [Terriglobus sp.]|uniref:non-homologous end-joining DNA ligase n=1 Tax=Terriglobus sp. TaxID=1889013 RepID=UPI003B00899A